MRKTLKGIKDRAGYMVGYAKTQRSYSQCGEDLLVNYVFNLRNIPKPSYIDIGANHPYFLSNTALFYSKGCSGINIEANPQLMSNFNRFRKRDRNINAGIGPVRDKMDFYIMNDATLSTFSKSEADGLVKEGNYSITQKISVDLVTISEILEKYNNNAFPDFLSIDVEGLDLQILQSIDFTRYWPKVICVEAAEYSPIGAGARRDDIIDFLVSKGYYEYANTNLNAIMVKREFWFI
jgi:FkbM family methyltransferase